MNSDRKPLGSRSGFSIKTGKALSDPALYESPDRRRGFYAFLKCRFLFTVALTIVVRSTACRLRKYPRITMVSAKLIIKPIIANPFYLSILQHRYPGRSPGAHQVFHTRNSFRAYLYALRSCHQNSPGFYSRPCYHLSCFNVYVFTSLNSKLNHR